VKGAHWLTLRKWLRNNSKSDIERLHKNLNIPETLRNTQKTTIY